MTDLNDLTQQAVLVERQYQNANARERLGLRPVVQRVIRTLAAHHQPIPISLQGIKRALDEEAYDDMFENMPV